MKDKDLIRRRFDRAMDTYQDNACVQDRMAARLIDMLCGEVRSGSCGKVLEIGCGTGLLTRRIVSRLHPEVLWLNDLCPSAERYVANPADRKIHFFSGDAETVDYPQGMDMIISSATVQWFDDFRTFLTKSAGALTDGGILAFSTFGKDNIREIAALEGEGLDYYDMEELDDLLAEKYKVLAAGEEIIQLHFSSPVEVLRHLRETGVTGLGKEKWTKGRQVSFIRRYVECFAEGETVSLTYNPIWIVAKKK